MDSRIKSTAVRLNIGSVDGSVRMDPMDKPWGDDHYLFSIKYVVPRFMRGINGRAFIPAAGLHLITADAGNAPYPDLNSRRTM